MRLAADENFKTAILRGLLRRRPSSDVVRVQDAGLAGGDDPTILAWAAGEGRVLLTHDAATMSTHAHARLARGEPMPGVIEVSWTAPVGAVIEDLVLILECSDASEWDGRVSYVPLA